MKVFVDYINDNNYSFDFDIEESFNLIAKYILEKHNFPEDAYLSVSIVDNDIIKELNSANRNIDSVTDVLSFPNMPMEKKADFDILNDSIIKAECYEYDTDSINIGDVVICYDRALEQANEYGHSVKREFCFLFAHSILHLIGFDHIDDNERMRMEEEQKVILDDLNITR